MIKLKSLIKEITESSFESDLKKYIDILNPKKFWRYNSTNKTWKNVLERSSG